MPGIEKVVMDNRLRISLKCLVSSCATVLVGVALWRAQYSDTLVDAGLLMYPHFSNVTTKHGWPVFWVLRNEVLDVFVPSSRQIDDSVLPWNLAVDLVAWIVVIIATARVSWRMCSCRGQFSLRFLFSITTVVAILLAWWRFERACCLVTHGVAHWLVDPAVPLLRLLELPPGVYIPVLLGIGCLILCAIDVTFSILARAKTRSCNLLKRTANKESK